MYAARHAFEAVLILAFGGPGGRADIRPFLQNVARGRNVPADRLERAAAVYELYGGVSPLTEITRRQAAALQDRLRPGGYTLPVYVGMRNWRPYIADVLAEMARAGLQRVIGIIASAFHSYPSCTQYKLAVRQAQRRVREETGGEPQITYVDSWYNHEHFIAANAERVRAALSELPRPRQEHARLIFTAHSIPLAAARSCRYVEQLAEAARLIIEKLGRRDWALAYQSRSGPPSEPWLEPELCTYLRAERAKGLKAAVLAPLGFVTDHIEVGYELDHRAAALGRELELPMARAAALNDHPLFIEMMADLVRQTCQRYRQAHPLPLVGNMDT